jgi:hypothetical protein
VQDPTTSILQNPGYLPLPVVKGDAFTPAQSVAEGGTRPLHAAAAVAASAPHFNNISQPDIISQPAASQVLLPSIPSGPGVSQPERPYSGLDGHASAVRQLRDSQVQQRRGSRRLASQSAEYRKVIRTAPRARAQSRWPFIFRTSLRGSPPTASTSRRLSAPKSPPDNRLGCMYPLPLVRPQTPALDGCRQ